jgi:hypothetical protein
MLLLVLLVGVAVVLRRVRLLELMALTGGWIVVVGLQLGLLRFFFVLFFIAM